MKFVRQFMIILAISFAGELLHALLALPVPASIYGLVLMLIGLQTGILPLNAVNEAGGFLRNSDARRNYSRHQAPAVQDDEGNR